MSRESRAKQREFLKLARPFFDKSLVRSFSSFEKPRHRLVISKSPIYQQKPRMQIFFFRKTSSSARHSTGPARLCIIQIACTRLSVWMLDCLGQ